MQEYIKRKLQHTTLYITILLFPIFYLFIPKQFAIIAMCFITLISIIIDISIYGNMKNQDTPYLLLRYKLSKNSYMALGFLITIILFSKGLAITSSIVLLSYDRCHALFQQKSFEESIALCLSAIMVSLFIFQIEPFHSNFWIVVISSVITSYLYYNSHRIPISHDIIIPLTFGGIISVLGIIFL